MAVGAHVHEWVVEEEVVQALLAVLREERQLDGVDDGLLGLGQVGPFVGLVLVVSQVGAVQVGPQVVALNVRQLAGVAGRDSCFELSGS